MHLNGHYDVVPVGNDWTRDPFGGELSDGWIYGRGAADMKSGLAAQVIAVEALRRTEWAGTIVQSAVPDEETVGVRNAGMGWLVEQGLVKADALIITEPFGPDGVGIGHKGAIWGEITLHGKQAHGSSPRLGINAVEAMARYLYAIDRHVRPLLEARVTDYGVTPGRAARDALLRHDPRRRRDQHRARPLHGHLQPAAGARRGPRRGARGAAGSAEGARPALRLPRDVLDTAGAGGRGGACGAGRLPRGPRPRP